MNSLLEHFINLFITALILAIFGRVIMLWISPKGTDGLSLMLHQITEPILAPLRKVIPSLGMFDLTPMIALILLNLIRSILISNL